MPPSQEQWLLILVINISSLEIISLYFSTIEDVVEKPGLITRGCFNSLQKKKLKSVDTQMCDRFYSIFLMSGMTRREFVQMCGLDQSSISRINEIKGHVTEPSKNMIV